MASKSENDSFIHDPHFVEWVLKPNEETNSYWNGYLKENPDKRREIEKEIFIIRSLSEKGKALADQEVEVLWNQIEAAIDSRKSRRLTLYRWVAAASILVILGLSGVIYYHLSQAGNKEFNYQGVAKIDVPDNEVKLVFSDKSEEIISSKNPNIQYNSNGNIQINSGKVLKRGAMGAEAMNQLIVPKGKRSNILLADGTRLWLNSGSRAIFPVVFKKEKREVYIEGEAYLEVAHDKNRPFYVATNNIKVRVLGTKFDVRAYADDQEASVILVEGRVQASVASKSVLMRANQMLRYEKNAKSSVLKNVDVLDFISWKDGWLRCNREKLDKIAAQLSRYYNVQIQFTDVHAKDLTLTGKLDLKNDYKAIFDVISSTAPIKYRIANNKILISTNN